MKTYIYLVTAHVCEMLLCLFHSLNIPILGTELVLVCARFFFVKSFSLDCALEKLSSMSFIGGVVATGTR